MEPGFVTKIHFARYDRRELDTYYRASWSFGTVPLLPPKITENQFVTQKKSKAYLLNCNEKIMLRKHWNVGGNRGKKAFARSDRRESDTLYPRSAFLTRFLPRMEVLSCWHLHLRYTFPNIDTFIFINTYAIIIQIFFLRRFLWTSKLLEL